MTKFDTDEFISNRSVIQREVYNGVRQRLSGKCCLPNCKSRKIKIKLYIIILNKAYKNITI